MIDTRQVTHIRAEGDPFNLGSVHGAALAASLRNFLDDGVTRLNHLLPEPVSLAGLQPAISAYRAGIAAATPDLAEEISGLAHGAGLSQDEATLLQLRREIMGYQKLPTLGDCTTYARSGARPVLAQTIDLNGDLDDQISVLEVWRRRRGALVLSFAGLLGYLGVNNSGLAVGLNLVLGGDWRPGVPPYLAIRHLLDTASSVDEAVRILRGLRLASSRSIAMCDTAKSAYVEVIDGSSRVVEGPEWVHTNHFLDPEFALRDELNVFAYNSSVRRLRAAQAELCELTSLSDSEEHFAVLSKPPICVPDEGDIRRERTVAAVVMRPDQGELHVRPGDPSRSATQVFSLT